MVKNILIIGGSGFIGTVLVNLLIKQGYQVRIGDKCKSEIYPELWAPCDVRQIDQLRKACESIDVIYNLAAEHRDDVKPVSLYDEVNVGGAEKICQVAREFNINHIIFTSSVSVYGFNINEVTEEEQPQPFNDYGRTKLAAEKIFITWQSESSTRRLTIVRPTAVFGQNNRGNIYNLIRQVAMGPAIMIGNGENKKSIAYVENVAAFLSYVILLETKFNLFNYVDKPDLAMNQLVAIIRESLNKPTHSWYLPYWIGLFAGKLCDFFTTITGKNLPLSSIRIKKFTANTLFSAQKALSSGFIPPVNLEQALHLTVKQEFS